MTPLDDGTITRVAVPSTAHSLFPPSLLLAPLQELTEQRLAIRLALGRARSDAAEEGLEIAAEVVLRRQRRAAEALEHLFRDGVSGPTRNGRRQVDVAPFGMTGRDLELVPLGEELLDETLDAPVSVATLGPIEHGENRRYRMPPPS